MHPVLPRMLCRIISKSVVKLRKATTAFIMSVCLLVCMEQFDSHWKDVTKFEMFIFFEKPSRKFKFY